MRREYGSRLFQLVDAPINDRTIVDLYAATAEALAIWEPRLLVQRVQIRQAAETGRIDIDLESLYLPTGEAFLLDGIQIK